MELDGRQTIVVGTTKNVFDDSLNVESYFSAIALKDRIIISKPK